MRCSGHSFIVLWLLSMYVLPITTSRHLLKESPISSFCVFYKLTRIMYEMLSHLFVLLLSSNSGTLYYLVNLSAWVSNSFSSRCHQQRTSPLQGSELQRRKRMNWNARRGTRRERSLRQCQRAINSSLRHWQLSKSWCQRLQSQMSLA